MNKPTIIPQTREYVIQWLKDNGITPIPIKGGTKEPVYEISEPALPTEGAFHKNTPKRMSIIENILENHNEYADNHGGLNIGIDCAPEWNNNRNFAFIDIDKPELVDNVLKMVTNSPVVRGKNGIKVLFFIETPPEPKYGLLFKGDERIGEFYCAVNRLCIIYGNHPVIGYKYSTEIYNHIIPEFTLEQFNIFFKQLLETNNFTLKSKETNNKSQVDYKNYKPNIINGKNYNAHSLTDFLQLQVTETHYARECIQSGSTLRGKPAHINDNFKDCVVIYPQTNTWKCFFHDTGGSALELLAIEWNILNCEECSGGNVIRGEKYYDMVAELIKHGYMTDKEYKKWMYLKRSVENVKL